ncbi:MAG: hypothetical protein KatS3mg101_0324 [Patescibacteria group bacterium]|nr:MAG: hypothetical protein KatS3mg101_0324 [Patescibacteria group bacterium]
MKDGDTGYASPGALVTHKGRLYINKNSRVSTKAGSSRFSVVCVRKYGTKFLVDIGTIPKGFVPIEINREDLIAKHFVPIHIMTHLIDSLN